MNKFMKTIFEMSTKDVSDFLHRWSTFHGKKCWLKLPKIEEGTVRPLLVAHIDKSRTNDKIQVFYDPIYGIAWSPRGLGGDDRCGVYSLLRIWCDLPEKQRPILLFCDEEERGGAGAREAAELFRKYLKNISCLVELDRRGAKDVVFYNNESKRFKKYIEKFGFKRSVGSFSDISILGREWQLAGANVSVGFYDNHTTSEIVKVHQLLNTITKITKLCIQASKEIRVWHNPNTVKKFESTYYSGITRGIHTCGQRSHTVGKAKHDSLTDSFPEINEKEKTRPEWYKGIRSRWYGRYFCNVKNTWISWEEHDAEVAKQTENKKKSNNFSHKINRQDKREEKVLEMNTKTGVYEEVIQKISNKFNYNKFRNIMHSIQCICYQCDNLPHSPECICEECGLKRIDAKEKVLNSEHDQECQCTRCFTNLIETVESESLELADLYSILKNHNTTCDCIDCNTYDRLVERADRLLAWEESLEEITDEIEEETYKYYCMECETPMHTVQCKDCMTYGSVLSEGGIILAEETSDVIFGTYIYTYYCYSCNKEFTEDYSMALIESPECPECNMPGTFAGQEVIGKHPDFLKHGMC